MRVSAITVNSVSLLSSCLVLGTWLCGGLWLYLTFVFNLMVLIAPISESACRHVCAAAAINTFVVVVLLVVALADLEASALIALGALISIGGVLTREPYRVPSPSLCGHCGYDLHATSARVCPECGTRSNDRRP